MAKLKYNASLVESAISELGIASSQVIELEKEMRSALTIVANARGIEYVNTDALFQTLGYPSGCQSTIENTISTIKTKASEIEEYNQKFENASFLQKLGATAGLFLTKICEGFATAGEQIVDGFASIIGFGAGLISKNAQESIGNFIAKDHVGDYFGNLYDTSLKNMVINSWASESGILCNIFKSVGTGLGYAAVLAATGGIAGGISGGLVGAKAGAIALTSKISASAALAGVAGIGGGTQAGLKGGLDYNSAFANGIKYGAIQAGTTVAFSYAFKALAKGWNILKTKMSGKVTSTGLTVVDDVADDVMDDVIDEAAGAANAGGPTTGTNGTTGTSGGPTSGPTTSGTTGGAAPNSNVTFKSQYQGYSSLDDVWDDVVAGKLTKAQVRDIIKNTVGLDDSGIGHSFMSDASNVLKGKGVSPNWKTMAANMSGIDDTAAAAATNGTTNAAGQMADDVFNQSGASVTQDAVKTAANNTTSQVMDDVTSAAGNTTGQVMDDVTSAAGNTTSQVMDDVTSAAGNTTGQVMDDVTSSTGNATSKELVEVVKNTGSGTSDDIANSAVKGQNSLVIKSTSAPALPPGPTPAPALPQGAAQAPALPPGPTPVPPGPTPVPALPQGATVATGDTVIFGVAEPEEIIPTPTITPGEYEPIITTPIITTTPPIITTAPPIVTTAPPIVTTAPPIVTTAPPIVTTAPPIVTTAPPIVTTAPPIVTTAPPIVTTAPPIVTTAPPIVTTAPPIVTTAPPQDAEYAPIPNTGIGGERNGFSFAPFAAGAAAGLAGIVGGSVIKNKNKEKNKDDIEELEERED